MERGPRRDVTPRQTGWGVFWGQEMGVTHQEGGSPGPPEDWAVQTGPLKVKCSDTETQEGWLSPELQTTQDEYYHMALADNLG